MNIYRKSNFANEFCYEIKTLKQSIQVTSRLMLRRFSRLSLFGQFLVILMFSFIAFAVLAALVSFTVNVANTSSFLAKHKCPACFGFKACDKIENGEITLTLMSNFWGMFGNSLRYYGTTEEGTDVILSKLGNSSQITEWEKTICSKVMKSEKCDVATASQKLFPMSGSKWIKKSISGHSIMTTCLTERMVNSMQFRYTETLDAIDMSARERIQMVLTLWISQEPLIYQMFPRQDNWPFTSYLGSCGRIVVYESPGESLYNFLEEPWTVRAELALKVLTIAHKLTDNPSKYGIYMLKIGFDTFHVNKKTKEVLYTSPEDIIVVDKWQLGEDKHGGWNKPHIRNFTKCDVMKPSISMDCSTTENWNDFDELCTKHYSDHNYYAVCRNILSPVYDGETIGLLKDIPKDIDKLYGIKRLIDRCVEPLPNEDRSEVSSQLRRNLEKILRIQS